MLSGRGARKLLAAEPLKNLLPVDEFLPIMFDKHPEVGFTFLEDIYIFLLKTCFFLLDFFQVKMLSYIPYYSVLAHHI